MPRDIIPSQSEYEKLLQEIRELQARIVELTAIRDDLLYHVCPSLRAIYDEKIGCIEREIMAAKLYLREKQRILEILQSQLNRQERVSVQDAEEKAGEEFRQYEEDLNKKAKEAEQFQNRWNETNWRQNEEEARKAEEEARKAEEEAAKNGSSGEQSGYQSEDGSNDSNTEGKKGSDQEGEADSDEEDERGEGARKPKNPVEALKRLYRKIVKRLHPDVHPNLTEREKELFNMATEAYQAGDLDKMEAIWDELESGTDPEERFEDTPEDLARLKEMLAKLRTRIHELTREISHIRGEYPYTMKDFLENEEAVEERRAELQKQLQEIRDADAKLAEFIEAVRKKMRDVK